MAYALAGTGNWVGNDDTDVTPLQVPLFAGISAGNLLILRWSTGGGGGIIATPPAGWLPLGERIGSGGTPRFFGKIATGSELATDTVPVTASAGHWCEAVITRWTGNPPTLSAIVNGTPTHRGGTTGLEIPRAPDATPTVAGCLVLRQGAKNCGGSGIDPISGSNFTKIGEHSTSNLHCGYLEYQVQTTATPVSSGTWNITTGDADVPSCGLCIVLIPGTGSTPAITNIDGDNVVTSNQTNVVATGTNFGSSAGTVQLRYGSISVALHVDSWSATSIQFDMALGNCRYGTCQIVITMSAGLSTSIAVTVNPPSGTSVFNLTTLRALLFDPRNCPSRLYSSPDLANNVQAEVTRTGGTGTVTADVDGRLQWADTALQIQWRFHDGVVWSSTYIWDLRGLAPVYIGPAPTSLTFTENVAITPINHGARFTNEDGDTLSFSVQGPALPTGLALASTTGIESGTPTVVGITSGIKIRATDTGSMYAETPVFGRTIEAAPNPPAFVGAIPATINGRIGESLTPFDAGVQFLFCTSFTIAPALPAGIALNPTTGEITGTPSVVGIFLGYVITGLGTGTPAFSNDFAFQIDRALARMPAVVGDTLATALTEIEAVDLVADLQFEASETIAGNIVIRQDPPSGTDVPVGTLVTINVSLGPTPQWIGPIPGTGPLTVGVLITPIAMATRFSIPSPGTLTYSAASPLPLGLTINSSSGLITGTPTTEGVVTGIVIRATSDTGVIKDSDPFSLVVNSAQPIEVVISMGIIP